MPIYEYECEECGNRYEELLAADASPPPCPACGGLRARRLLSGVAPPGRQPRGSKVRSEEGRRQEAIAGHKERLTRDKAKRAKGETP
jgi:putative FmdB family regulatory protein